MPDDGNTIAGIPGVRGRDYEVVNYSGRMYVVYKTKLPNGKYVMDAWRISPQDAKSLKIGGKVKHITKSQFKGLEVFGDFGEIVNKGGGQERPLQTYMKELREIYGGNSSWLQDKEYMEIFLMGYMENWDPGELQQRLKRTKWYQSRTAAERAWELDMNKADREAALGTARTQVEDAIKDLYGTISLKEAGITSKMIDEWATQIASGKLGDPSTGFQTWLERQTDKAEKVEGSAAWIDRQSMLEEQRGFLNRPEDMFEQLRNDATEWLGPKGVPDRATLMDWAEKLTSERASDGDWQQYLRQTSKALYPWLGPNERWQDRASVYKNILEEELGRPVGWNHGMLYELGAKDANGKPTNTPLSFDEFGKQVRATPEWWGSAKAEEEGFDLFNSLNSVFNGVS